MTDTSSLLHSILSAASFIYFERTPNAVKRHLASWFKDSAVIFEERSIPTNALNTMHTMMCAKKEDVEKESLRNCSRELSLNIDRLYMLMVQDEETYDSYVLNILRTTSKFFRQPTHDNMDRVKDFLPFLSSSPILRIFFPEVADQKEAVARTKKEARLQAIVMKVSGRPGYSFSKEELRILRNTNRDRYEDYTKVRLGLMTMALDKIKWAVQDSGEKFISVRKAMSIFKRHRLRIHPIPKGFSGNIDVEGNLYAGEKKLEKIPDNIIIRMNPKYDSESDDTHVCESVVLRRKFFTERYVERHKDDIGIDHPDYLDSIDRVSDTWRADIQTIRSPEIPCILEVAYSTQADVSSLISLPMSSVQFLTNGDVRLTIQDSPKHVVTISPKHGVIATSVITKIKEWADGRYAFGSKVTLDSVQEYLFTLNPDLTIDRFHYLRPTDMLWYLIERDGFEVKGEVSQAELEKWLDNALLQVRDGTFTNLTVDDFHRFPVKEMISSRVDPNVMAVVFGMFRKDVPEWLRELLKKCAS